VTKELLEEWVARKKPEKLPVEVPVVEIEKECKHCCEQPCVWIAKKEDMIFYDESEHGLLPKEDLPPNNIRHKKLYHQMTLHLQDGVVQKGVRHELPTCVELGTRELFPSRQPLWDSGAPTKT
jgi:hypothetical protein